MGILFARSIGCALHTALQNFMQLFIFPCAGKAGMSRLYLSNPCAFFSTIAHGAAGAVSARLSLRPLSERGTTNWQSSDKSCRENEEAHSVVVPANAGTHNHDCVLLKRAGAPASRPNSILWLWVPGRASLARDDSEFADSIFQTADSVPAT